MKYISFLILLLVGCTGPKTPIPKPSVTVGIIEKTDDQTYVIEVTYTNHGSNWAKASFTEAEDVAAYRSQLEIAVTRLKEAEERMNASNIGGTDERSVPISE